MTKGSFRDILVDTWNNRVVSHIPQEAVSLKMTVYWNLIFQFKSQQIQLVVFITFHQNENFLLILSILLAELLCCTSSPECSLKGIVWVWDHLIWLCKSPISTNTLNLLVLNCYLSGIKKEYGMNSGSGAGISTLFKCR